MENFYQSDLRQHINRDVYQKPTIDVVLFGKTYQAVLWQKKRGFFTITRIQILGVFGRSTDERKKARKELLAIQKKYRAFFIQIGCIDITHEEDTKNITNATRIRVFQKSREIRQEKVKKYGYLPSPKENLPPSTIIIDITKPIDLILQGCSAGHRNKIKKAGQHNVLCHIATPEEAQQFYPLLAKTGNAKGFGTISAQSFTRLIQDIYTNNSGMLYVAFVDGILAAGALYLLPAQAQTAFYLYGATERSLGNIGIGQYIHRYIFQDLKNRDIKTVDLFGGAPTGDKNHHLAAVSAFKEGFGGRKREVAGSYDIVYNPIIYLIRKTIYRNLF